MEEISKTNKKYLLGVKLIPHLNWRLNKVLDVFDSPEQAWSASEGELKYRLDISDKVARKIVLARKAINIEAEIEKYQSLNVEMISSEDKHYPKLLKEISSPPVMFVRGGLIKNYEYAVGVVGSRRASTYGKEFAYELSRKLSDLGVTIVSGAARGIDSAAHFGAISGKGGSIGVLGCGLDVVYPPENRKLYAELEQKGSLVSEYALGTQPLSQNFPARNRIISGLSEGIVVVEASEKSGALITADFALEQGREVMVVPGNVRSAVSKGCHKLIKQGACLIESVEDVIENLQLDSKIKIVKEVANANVELELSCEEKAILNCLEWEPKQVDQIVASVGIEMSKIAGLLTILEIKGIIKQDIGKNYLRVR